MSNNNFPPRNTRNSQKAKNDTHCLSRDNSRARNYQGREGNVYEQPGASCPSGQRPRHTDRTGPRTDTSDTPCLIPGTPSCSTDNWEYTGTPSLLETHVREHVPEPVPLQSYNTGEVVQVYVQDMPWNPAPRQELRGRKGFLEFCFKVEFQA
ncbi:hypothetical protein BY996DRAFT_6509409 [Phakopsora pachyrhizi]|nr:hypothetical protein BY996DRAFT_6509409 [Phakopsora pachyrhizi]